MLGLVNLTQDNLLSLLRYAMVRFPIQLKARLDQFCVYFVTSYLFSNGKLGGPSVIRCWNKKQPNFRIRVALKQPLQFYFKVAIFHNGPKSLQFVFFCCGDGQDHNKNKIGPKSLQFVCATFVRIFLAKTFKKLPNLVTLASPRQLRVSIKRESARQILTYFSDLNFQFFKLSTSYVKKFHFRVS